MTHGHYLTYIHRVTEGHMMNVGHLVREISTIVTHAALNGW